MGGEALFMASFKAAHPSRESTMVERDSHASQLWEGSRSQVFLNRVMGGSCSPDITAISPLKLLRSRSSLARSIKYASVTAREETWGVRRIREATHSPVVLKRWMKRVMLGASSCFCAPDQFLLLNSLPRIILNRLISNSVICRAVSLALTLKIRKPGVPRLPSFFCPMSSLGGCPASESDGSSWR